MATTRNGRLWIKNPDEARGDHLRRYHFARDILEAEPLPGIRSIADLGSGCGYGSAVLARRMPWDVTGYEVDPEAVAFSRQHYGGGKQPVFARRDICDPSAAWPDHDAVVAFEVAEHVEDFFGDCGLMHKVPLAIVSTPNEEHCPFTKERYPFHVRHYLPAEFDAALRACGFTIIEYWHQSTKEPGDIMEGPDGRVMIAIAERTTS